MVTTVEGFYFEIKAAARKACKSDEYAYLAGEEGTALRDLREEVAEGLKHIDALLTHTHEWDCYDYCRLCGADGRA